MNLDNEIKLIRDEVMRLKSLDIVDDKFLQFNKICEDIKRESDRISAISIPEVNVCSRVSSITQTAPQSVIFYSDLCNKDGKEFVENLYKQILGREPDAEGLKHYLELFEAGKMTKDDLICSIGLSEEAEGRGTKIRELDIDRINPQLLLRFHGEAFIKNSFLWILGREADANGLRDNLEALNAGEYKEMILYYIKNSEEGKRRKVQLNGIDNICRKVRIRKRIKSIPGVKQMVGAVKKAKKNSRKAMGMDMANAASKIEEIMCELDKVREKIEELSNGFVDIRSEVGGLSGDITDTKSRIVELSKDIIDTKSKAVELSGNITDTKSKVEELSENITDTKSNVVELSEDIADTKSKVVELSQGFVDTKAEIREVMQELAGTKNVISNMLEEHAKLREDIDTSKKWIENLEINGSRLQNEITELKKQVDGIERINVDFRHSTELSNKDIESNRAQFDLLRSWTDQIGLNVHNNNIVLEKLDKAYDSYLQNDKRTVELLEAETSKLKAAVNNLRSIETIQDIRSGNEQSNKSIETDSVSRVMVNEGAYDSIDYFDFENHFRGNREHIKEVQKMYLPYFTGRKHVLDLGCGRGEFIEMLTENDVDVTGVDTYEPYVEYLKMRNLNAVYADAVEYLRKQDKIDGIFMGQVVEHIPVQSIIEICNLAYEKLEKGAYLIMETPNPMSLAIYTECFYMDPSHLKPVHPKTLQYIVQKAGFKDVEILFTDSSKLPYKIPELKGDGDDISEFNAAMKKVEEILYGSQDYAVIAKR